MPENLPYVAINKVVQFQYLDNGSLTILLSNGEAYHRSCEGVWSREDFLQELIQFIREHGTD
jgi:hypothetical protein